MALTLIQDIRYGDTGKGKISEYLSHPDRCDVSVRAVGGGNAGHVIMRDTRKVSLHILPAGCVHEDVDLVLGRGMVTHLPTLFEDAQKVNELFGTKPLDRLVIDGSNHLLFEGHKAADKALEIRRGERSIGTTKTGIGPAYADKANRIGIRMEDLKLPLEQLQDKYRGLFQQWLAMYDLKNAASLDPTIDLDQIQALDIAALKQGQEAIGGKIQRTLTTYWRQQFGGMARVVIEGAQGSNLSIDSDRYPYVTSSPTTVYGHLQGAGIPAREPKTVVGVLKAYDTRVGNGPMRTEFEPEKAERIQKKGGEFGSTTGRGRRTGDLDLEDAANRAYEEGVDVIALMKSDVLDDEGAVSYAVDSLPDGSALYNHIDGWTGTQGVQRHRDLHDNLKAFIRRIEQRMEAPVKFIGTGPESSELIVRKV